MNVEALSGESRHSASPTWNKALWSARIFDTTSLAVWTRQLAGLIKAGLPLERALSALADEAERPSQQNLIATLRAEVTGGASLARALGLHSKEFDTSYRAVVAAGEQGGQLAEVLQRLADDLESQDSLKQKLISASLYPLIVTLFAIAIVVFLMTYVVPQVANAFSGGDQVLPAITVIMLGLSSLIRNWGWLLALAALAVIGAVTWVRSHPESRRKFDALWLTLPLVGRLARGYNAARFAATLAILCNAGVPILRALQTAADTLNNHALRYDALAALMMIREGAPIATALAAKKRFPNLLTLFIRLGEQTGELPEMLAHASEQLGADVQRRALRLATLLEPILIVAMGVIVLLIVLAVMLPIIQLNQLVQ